MIDLRQICSASASPAQECPTGDGGMTWEIEDSFDRTLLFAAPDTGTPVYFTADVPGVLRHAGIVETAAGASGLVEWVGGGKFPVSGVILG
jgi:hypothetical protein